MKGANEDSSCQDCVAVARRLVEELGVSELEFFSVLYLSGKLSSIEEVTASPAAMKRIGEVVEVLNIVSPWAGSYSEAWSWYCFIKIGALGDLTPKELVAQGRARDVIAYISHISDGGYS